MQSISAFYNDTDQFCCAWLSNLMDAGHITPGKISDKSIVDLSPDDFTGFVRIHLFAGIAGWDLALNLAGWDDRPVITGSCPCQPLSSAGQQHGHADERHLWPAFYALIAECRPATIFGEQVASKDGREWLAGVRADLEHLGYAVGAADLPAASVGAPHIRQRLFWVADASGISLEGRGDQRNPAVRCRWSIGTCGVAGGLGDAALNGCRQGGALIRGRDAGDRAQGAAERSGTGGSTGGMGDTASEPLGRARQSWQDSVWLPCLDGKARRTQSGIFPLAHGVPNRVGILRGAGNAIVPQVAAAFVSAFLEIIEKSEERTSEPKAAISE